MDFSIATGVTPTPKIELLFDLQSGQITEEFKRQMALVGIVAKQFFSQYDPYHILNVNELLQSNGCYQKDWDLYKKGGESNFKISYEQAVKFLEDDYSKRETLLPELTSELTDGIVCSGVYPDSLKVTLYKRLRGLEASINERGLNYKTVYVLCKNEEIKRLSQDFINQTYKEKFGKIEFNYIVANTENEIGLTCLQELKKTRSIKNCVVITDGTSAQKDFLTATSVLTEVHFLGVASDPIKDWKSDMNLYDYKGEFNSDEKATIAWASSAWNFIARRVNTEMQAYKKMHHIS